MNTEIINCECWKCCKRYKRTYNITLAKFSRGFNCKCGSTSFRWWYTKEQMVRNPIVY